MARLSAGQAAGESRAIFITGGASGIGRATARLFAARQWRVGILDLDVAGVETVLGELRSADVWGQPLDVCDPQAFRRAVSAFGAWAGGRMDVLFQSAGLMSMGRFEEVPLEERLQEIRVNVLGVVIGIAACLDLLRSTPGARVVTMGSASALYGVPELSTYSASKFFVRGLTEALSLELEGDGVAVSDIWPLYVDTPMIQRQRKAAGTLRNLGARLSAEQVAEIVWRAAHGKRVHWVPGVGLRFARFLAGAAPALYRPIVRFLSRGETDQRK